MTDLPMDRFTYATEFIKGDWDKAIFLDSPQTDHLVAALVGLGAEFWALRRRVMVLEKFIEDRNLAPPDAIENYKPTDAEQAAWDQERDAYIHRIFDALVSLDPSDPPSGESTKTS